MRPHFLACQMNLGHTKRTYEKLGREDPFYAVLTVPQFRHNRWDPREFYANGEREIAEVLAYLERLGLAIPRSAAFDFGCGVGRLTQALGDHFDRVTGVDIAASMVEKAQEMNRHGERVDYRVNDVDHLGQLADASFDFIYSSITLQHVPPPANSNYVREFMRLLRPGGVALFQVPNGAPIAAGSWQETWYRFRKQTLRRIWKRMRGKPAYEMHYIPRAEIEGIVAQGGATMIDVTHFGEGAVDGNYRYCAQRAA